MINKDERRKISRISGDLGRVPPTGFEPVHPPPEGGALSPELRGRRSTKVTQLSNSIGYLNGYLNGDLKEREWR